MRALALAGLIAIAFGLGSYYATGALTHYATLNLSTGALALAAAALIALRRLRFAAGSHSRRVLLRGLLGVAGALALAIALERAATWTGWRADLTFEQSFELAPATRKVLAELPGDLTATLYHDRFDPRARNTRLLLASLAEAGPLTVRERLLADEPEDADRYGIAASNTVVLTLGSRFETVERPLEATLYEALYRLRSRSNGVIGVLRGEGEGDVSSEAELGFAGLAAALATEGYALHSLVSSSLAEVPADIDVILLLGPRRAMLPESLAALERYLERGGRLVALLEPGVQSGIEPLLARWGIDTPAGVIIDPASGGAVGGDPGVDPIAFNYETHPLARGLNADRMTFFAGARPLVAHNTGSGDNVRRVVLSSPRSWRVPGSLAALPSRRSARARRGAAGLPCDRRGRPLPARGRRGAHRRFRRQRLRFQSLPASALQPGSGVERSALGGRARIGDHAATEAAHAEAVPAAAPEHAARLPRRGTAGPGAALLAGGLIWLRRRTA